MGELVNNTASVQKINQTLFHLQDYEHQPSSRIVQPLSSSVQSVQKSVPSGML